MKVKVFNKVIIIFFALIIVCSTQILAGTILIEDVKKDVSLGPVDQNFKDVGIFIVSIIRNIGVVISVIVVAIVGIKYMYGTAEERADYKKSMLPYLIGAFCLSSASIIVEVIYNVAINLGTP